MSDMLADGLAFMTSVRKANLTRDAVYTRGSQSIDIRVELGRKLLRLDDGTGQLRVEMTDLDILVASDLDFSFDGIAPLTPERGDLLTLVMPYDTQVFEVLPLGGEPAWRWSDSKNQSMYRIHLKLVDQDQST